MFLGVNFSNLWLSRKLLVCQEFPSIPSFPQETLEERPACVDAMVELLEMAGKGFGPLALANTKLLWSKSGQAQGYLTGNCFLNRFITLLFQLFQAPQISVCRKKL